MHLSFVWHFHQPIYKNPFNGEYVLPWVNFHAVKNYYQMAFLTAEAGFPCTFNFVPCLLEQLLEYADGTAVDPYQQAMEKDARRLTFAEMNLLQKIAPGPLDPVKLQMKAVRSMFSPVVEAPPDKEGLLALQKRILKEIIPFYKRLQGQGLAELTTSAYYHPLLPALFDLAAAKPEPLPVHPFRHPEDGLAQVRAGREYFRKVFGFYPQGLWPSEGGVSREVVSSLPKAGFSFCLTDENILWKSLGASDRKKLYQPYQCGGMTLFFRDRELSDLLSFEYQKWTAEDAARDFLAKLVERAEVAPEDDICVIILDGENPWECYPQNGVPFLRELFSSLKNRNDLTPIFLADYLRGRGPAPEIEIVPGTWLGNFSKWVGHPDKNKAWDILSEARQACGPLEEIYVAEGSDWFWWYGEEDKCEFDFLFKSYIQKAYDKAGVKNHP